MKKYCEFDIPCTRKKIKSRGVFLEHQFSCISMDSDNNMSIKKVVKFFRTFGLSCLELT